MGRGLSELQKSILRLALKVEAFSGKPRKEYRKSKYGEPGGSVLVDGKWIYTLGALSIAEEVYGARRFQYGGTTITPAMRVSISRAMRRLRDRDLVAWYTTAGNRASVALTDQGVEVAAGLR